MNTGDNCFTKKGDSGDVGKWARERSTQGQGQNYEYEYPPAALRIAVAFSADVLRASSDRQISVLARAGNESTIACHRARNPLSKERDVHPRA